MLQSAEDLVKNTLNLVDKVGEAVASTLSHTDPPLALVTDSIAITISVKDVANSTGEKMVTGNVTIELAENDGQAGNLPLQVCCIEIF